MHIHLHVFWTKLQCMRSAPVTAFRTGEIFALMTYLKGPPLSIWSKFHSDWAHLDLLRSLHEGF